MSSRTWFAVVACVVGAFFAACGGKVEAPQDTSTGGAAHGGSTGMGGHLTGGTGGTGGSSKGGAGTGGSSKGGAAGWGGWGGSPTCEAVDPNDTCAVCAASACCSAFLACDNNPVCTGLLACAADCFTAPEAGYVTYADCLTQCANAAGNPPEMVLLDDWYTCLCLQSCKGPCEYFEACP